jgi:hypothetical protein
MPGVSVSTLIGLSGVSLSVLATWFQFRRSRRISVDGISLVTWYQFVLMGLFWIAYGTAQHSTIVVAGSVLCAPLQIAIVARLEPWRHLGTIARASAFIFCCCGLSTLLFGWAGGALGTGVAMAANRLPQIIELVRHPGDLGVSVSSWAVGAACSVVWIGYYATEHLTAALVATLAGMMGNVTIAALAQWRHTQRVARVGELVGPLAR